MRLFILNASIYYVGSPNLLPALLQKLVGDFFVFGECCGKFGGKFAGLFQTPLKNAQKNGRKVFGAFFVRTFVPRTTYFVPTSLCRRTTLRF